MVSFTDLIYRLENIGLTDAILPFFLIFVVVFAILQKSKILHKTQDDDGTDEKGRAFDAVVALILGLIVVVPHVLGLYPSDADVVLIMNAALPNIALILVAIVGVFLILGLFGGSAAWAGKFTGWVAVIAFILVGYIFMNAAGWFQTTPNWLAWLDDPDTQAILIVFAVFALVIYFITKKPSDGSAGKALGDFGKEFGLLVGRKGGNNDSG